MAYSYTIRSKVRTISENGATGVSNYWNSINKYLGIRTCIGQHLKKVINKLLYLGLELPVDYLCKADIFIFPDFIAWPTKKAKTISVVHDLTYIHYPECVEEKNRKFLGKCLPPSVERSTHIVANSEYTKRDIIDHFTAAKGKISVVTPGLDHDLFKPATSVQTKKIRARYALPQRFILFVGTLEPRKNLETLVSAYEQLDPKLQDACKLVIAGGKGWKDEQLIRHLESNDNVIRTGYIDSKDLPALYSAAEVFVLPSHFEGFGMPILEAQACGTPVITADNSSLPEAAGKNGALFFDSKKPSELAEKIEKVLTDKSISEKLKEAGFANAKKYSWEKSAEKMRKIIEKVYEQNSN